MKHLLISSILVIGLCTGLPAQTNDFYDDDESHPLKPTQLVIKGEVEQAGPVSLEGLPLRSVVVKETRFDGKNGTFTGAYRYDGYSLYDILNKVVIKKANEAEFPPIIDLMVEVENDKGEKAVFSWGEVYYPIHRHEILIAVSVARIVPSKTKDLWPLPEESKIVVASDLYTERNISSPATITVRSHPGKFNVKKGMENPYSADIQVIRKNKKVVILKEPPAGLQVYEFPSVFYGRGRGIHGTTPFRGVLLKDVIKEYAVIDSETLRTGYLVVTGIDGYRGVFTYSELFNRNDQAEFLLIYGPEEKDGGAFRLFPAADFFSDRAIKAVKKFIFEAPH